jgi:hypothetical protein
MKNNNKKKSDRTNRLIHLGVICTNIVRIVIAIIQPFI